MTRHLRVTLDGELIATGREVQSSLMFWHAINVDEVCDMGNVIERLEQIRVDRGFHFEVAGNRFIRFAPIFKVEEFNPLAAVSTSTSKDGEK